MKAKENTSFSIIGGADGPTSVFIAGKQNGNLAIRCIIIGIVLFVVAEIIFFKRKH